MQYTFIPKLEEKWFCKPWLTVEPSAGLVKQRKYYCCSLVSVMLCWDLTSTRCLDDSKTLEVSVFVKADTAGPLTAGREKIEDILVLHLQGGKDFFVSFVSYFHVNFLNECLLVVLVRSSLIFV